MKVILLSSSRHKSLSFEFGRWTRSLALAAIMVLPTVAGVAIGLSVNDSMISDTMITDYSSGKTLTAATVNPTLKQQAEQTINAVDLGDYRGQLAVAEARAEQKVQALSLKLAQLQARMLRLDAVGERVSGLAGLDKGEFNFGDIPAIGGPEQPGQVVEQAEISAMFRDLENQLDNREQQLNMLKDMMGDRNVKRESTVAGLPMAKGWLSSGYGMRTDPFNGRKTWHKGIDFAGKGGSDVIAVAAGLVTQAQGHKGYGHMVEIDHGDGLVTRYAHNRKNLVNTGDMVKKGQVIALMGKTGRSTGPHVHFEVYKDGSPVNPASYIHRTTL
ncbi:MAG: M23 family metallopeptidase [Porticoccaceae bacterium]